MSAHFFHYENKPKTKIKVEETPDFPNEGMVKFDDDHTIFLHKHQLQMLASELADYLLGRKST